jgi:hypothetical protein
MTRKLITFLGTGNYGPCRYEWGGVLSSPVRYVQISLADLLNPDRLIVFTTPSAFEANYAGPESLLAAARAGAGDIS